MAKQHDISFNIDAEEANRLLLSLDIIEALFLDSELDWDGFGVVVQAYQFTALSTLDWLINLAKKNQKTMLIRLVKGAYWDAEIKSSQQQGLAGFPVFTRKMATDCQYLLAAKKLLANIAFIYPQFATHNAYTVAMIIQMAEQVKGAFEFQRLHGMGEALFEKVMQDHQIPCRVYAPVGVHEELLAYLVRRLLENGANSSFVNAILDESKPISSLLTDPFEQIQKIMPKANTLIKRSDQLYTKRLNSMGYDLTHPPAVIDLARQLNRITLDTDRKNNAVLVKSPANHDEVLGGYNLDSVSDIQIILDQAKEAEKKLSIMPVEERTQCLLRLADLIEKDRIELIYLCIQEAEKLLKMP